MEASSGRATLSEQEAHSKSIGGNRIPEELKRTTKRPPRLDVFALPFNLRPQSNRVANSVLPDLMTASLFDVLPYVTISLHPDNIAAYQNLRWKIFEIPDFKSASLVVAGISLVLSFGKCGCDFQLLRLPGNQ